MNTWALPGTRVTDTATRIVSVREPDVPHLDTDRGPVAVANLSATYYGRATAPGQRREWVINAHVTGPVIGQRGKPTTTWSTRWFVVHPGDHPDNRENWPTWLVMWLEAHHPDRGGPDNDPEGSYLG